MLRPVVFQWLIYGLAFPICSCPAVASNYPRDSSAPQEVVLLTSWSRGAYVVMAVAAWAGGSRPKVEEEKPTLIFLNWY